MTLGTWRSMIKREARFKRKVRKVNACEVEADVQLMRLGRTRSLSVGSLRVLARKRRNKHGPRFCAKSQSAKLIRSQGEEDHLTHHPPPSLPSYYIIQSAVGAAFTPISSQITVTMFRNALRTSTRAAGAISSSSRFAAVCTPINTHRRAPMPLESTGYQLNGLESCARCSWKHDWSSF